MTSNNHHQKSKKKRKKHSSSRGRKSSIKKQERLISRFLPFVVLILLLSSLYVKFAHPFVLKHYDSLDSHLKWKGQSDSSEVEIDTTVEQPAPNIKRSSSGLRMISHKGYNQVAPENTIHSFKAAFEDGYTEVETDVQFTKDNIPVILHNVSINEHARNSDGSVVGDKELYVKDLTYDELYQYDFGIYFSEQFAGTKILKFEDFIALAKEYDAQYLHIELKSTYTKEQKQILYNIVYNNGFSKKVSWMSNNLDNLKDFDEIDDTASLEFLFTYFEDIDLDKVKEFDNGKRKITVSTWYDMYDEEFNQIQTIKDAGYDFNLFTVNDAETVKKIATFPVDGVITDASTSIFE